MGLSSCGLKQIDDGHRNLGPTQLPASLQTALSCDHPARRCYHDRVEKADIGDTVGE
jgi:hypothetical protein